MPSNIEKLQVTKVEEQSWKQWCQETKAYDCTMDENGITIFQSANTQKST